MLGSQMGYTPMRLLILGTGRMAGAHAEAFSKIAGVTLAGCVDIDTDRAEAFAAEHAIPMAFTSLVSALESGEVDAAANCTPDASHFETTMAVLEAGTHVFCEKPLATTYEDVAQMAAKARSKGIIHGVNLTYRNVAALQTARTLIAEGRIGHIRHFEASYLQSWLTQSAWGDWRSDPTWLWRLSTEHGSLGVLGDVGIHILDFLTYAAGQNVAELTGRLGTFDKAEDGRIDGYTLDANDSFSATVALESGALGVIHATRFAPGNLNDLSLQIYGTKGGLKVTNTGPLGTLRVCEGDNLEKATWVPVVLSPVKTNFERFAEAVQSGAGMVPDFDEGARLQAVLDGVFRAHNERRQISLYCARI